MTDINTLPEMIQEYYKDGPSIFRIKKCTKSMILVFTKEREKHTWKRSGRHWLLKDKDSVDGKFPKNKVYKNLLLESKRKDLKGGLGDGRPRAPTK